MTTTHQCYTCGGEGDCPDCDPRPNTTTIPANETRYVGEIAVQRSRILGTPFVVYSAWEPGHPGGQHQTITTIDERWYGRIHSRRDDETFRHLPGGSPERIAAVRAAYAANDAEAYAAILAAFPEAADGTRTDGDIEVRY